MRRRRRSWQFSGVTLDQSPDMSCRNVDLSIITACKAALIAQSCDLRVINNWRWQLTDGAASLLWNELVENDSHHFSGVRTNITAATWWQTLPRGGGRNWLTIDSLLQQELQKSDEHPVRRVLIGWLLIALSTQTSSYVQFS